ncbi:hypothetical protein CORC01_04311 [Colletotrichum orchidophilum]|uniref:Uncharacterized protein n=1 Tax=Colletotrichum orchidophilum TaxID=1209926 RepID=A0A1G4BFQ1_9PEZI|nr:uncharacterized protein CORC01_04311 [Colletotrichum orchidophilum]OHF00330.1 hypothetical protein CORC01_04311 [Colletotrichum orchidophilum]
MALDGPGHPSCTPHQISRALLEWFISFPMSPSSICICISIRTCPPAARGSLGKGNNEITKEGEIHTEYQALMRDRCRRIDTPYRFPYTDTRAPHFYRTHPRHPSRWWARGFPKNRNRSVPAHPP